MKHNYEGITGMTNNALFHKGECILVISEDPLEKHPITFPAGRMSLQEAAHACHALLGLFTDTILCEIYPPPTEDAPDSFDLHAISYVKDLCKLISNHKDQQ